MDVCIDKQGRFGRGLGVPSEGRYTSSQVSGFANFAMKWYIEIEDKGRKGSRFEEDEEIADTPKVKCLWFIMTSAVENLTNECVLTDVILSFSDTGDVTERQSQCHPESLNGHMTMMV
ncbi:hypothetical protein CAPTEDRAFT_196635 [Capitella teleta]|uniref:Uncharacterized protein n=1 Tax=Capitella teleta TaxID=283909 RepID=R7TSV1_CAPTE|nr:hypothetical protein CAPTEDRAFT_196635 [Capitella teleta]|eukprot:ELT96724.1 hypothetical protein CAPTEDRAFT_196635 [Capitella teleta]